jgi:hypothetical protein
MASKASANAADKIRFIVIPPESNQIFAAVRSFIYDGGV